MNTPQQTPDHYPSLPRGLITPTEGDNATPLYNPNNLRNNSLTFLQPSQQQRNLAFPRPVYPASANQTPIHHSIHSIKSQYGTGLSSVIDVVNGGPSSVLSRQQSIDNTPTPGPTGLIMPRTPHSLSATSRYYDEHQPMSSGAIAGTIANIPQPQLQNIVCTVNLCCKLDLKKIALQSRNAEYNPKRFAAVIMRIREPRTTALIFSSGKMVCTGAKSEDLARQAARKYARIIQKLSFNAHFKDFKIQNMVASCDVGFNLRLEGLVIQHNKFSTYEPELFPGLIYRMTKPKIVLLLFVSGKVVLTGAKLREEIYQAFEHIYPVLKNFRKA